MKTAVSIPDDLYNGAERLARTMKMSRSRVFSAALDEYVAHHTDDEITQAMNAALIEVGEQRAPFIEQSGRRALERTER